jgi:hypothetical protein
VKKGGAMRFLVWTWRVVAVIVLGTFVATVYYVTHERFTDVSGMDGVLPALNLVTVIGVGLLGVVWTLARRYWHALFLLASLGVVRGLLGDELLTEFQNFWLFISIGVVGLVFVVSLTARALANERKLKSVATWSTAQPQFRPSPAPEVITPSVVTVPVVEEPATTEPASQPDPGKKGSKDS